MKNKLRQSIQEHAFNEEEMLRNIMNTARSQGIKPKMKPSFHFIKPFAFKSAFASLVLLSLLLVALYSPALSFLSDSSKTITAVYGLEINPSFEISVNKNDTVIKITAINEDALDIKVDDLIGADATEVIETLIKRAEFSGYIDTKDLVEDYVLVSTIPMSSRYTPQTDGLQTRFNEATKGSTYLQNLNLALATSTLAELKTAEEKKISIGLMVINGLIKEPNGSLLSTREFFSDPTNRLYFQTKGIIKEDKVNRQKARILIALGKLDTIGIETLALKVRLITAKNEELILIQNEVILLLNKFHLGSPYEIKADLNFMD